MQGDEEEAEGVYFPYMTEADDEGNAADAPFSAVGR